MSVARTLPIAEVATSVFDGPFGSNLKSSDYAASGTRVVRLENIGHRRFIAEKETFISDEKAAGLARHRLSPGDVLFSSFVENAVRVCLFPAGLPTPAINKADCFCIRVNRDVALPEFVALRLASRETFEVMCDLVHGATRPRVGLDALKNYRIEVPPLAEQRRIVARIEALFVRIRRARADLERVESLARATMKATINSGLNGSLTAAWRRDNPDQIWTGNQVQSLEHNRTKYLAGRRGVRLTRLPEFRKPGVDKDLPLTWLRGCIADAATLKLGYAFKSDWFSKSGPRLLRGANISPGRLDWSDEKLLSPSLANEFAAYRVRVGDIVIAMDRPMISTGLKIARVPPEDDGSLLVQRVASPELSAMLDTGYLWCVLQASAFLEQIERRSTGSDLPHISGNDILETVMPLPPLLEQRQIALQLDKVAAKLLPIRTDSARALALLDRLEHGILALAFRGELVSQDESTESAVLSLAAIEAPPRPRKRRAA